MTTCEGAAVTCSDGVTTLEGTGSPEFELPNVGDWTVTATLNEQTATQLVEVSGALLDEVDLMITEGIAVTTQPNKKSYYIGGAFDPACMVVTATFSDDTTAVSYTHLLHAVVHGHRRQSSGHVAPPHGARDGQGRRIHL